MRIIKIFKLISLKLIFLTLFRKQFLAYILQIKPDQEEHYFGILTTMSSQTI